MHLIVGEFISLKGAELALHIQREKGLSINILTESSNYFCLMIILFSPSYTHETSLLIQAIKICNIVKKITVRENLHVVSFNSNPSLYQIQETP